MKSYFLLLCLLSSYLIHAQFAETTGHNLKTGEKLNITIDLRPKVQEANELETLSPSILVLGPKKIFMNDSLSEAFYSFLQRERVLFQYRYLRSFADSYKPRSKNLDIEKQFMRFNQKCDDFFLIAEKWNTALSQTLHKTFVYPLTATRDLSPNDSSTLNDIGRVHLFRYTLLLDEIKMGYQEDNYVFSAKLMIADSSFSDSLSLDTEIFARGQTVDAGMQMLISTANVKVIQHLVRDEELRKTWAIQNQRSAALLANYPQVLGKNQIKALKKADLEEDNYYHTINSQDETRFIALAMEPYERDIHEGIKRALFINPYPDLDISIISDPMQPTFFGTATIGLKAENEWFVNQTMGYDLHAKTLKEAQDLFIKKVQVLGLFEDGTANFNPNYWNKGPFKLIDSTYLFQELNEIYSGDSAKILLNRNNLSPYIGYPKFEAERIHIQSFFAYIQECREFSDTYFYRLFKKVDKYNDTLGIYNVITAGANTIHDQKRKNVIIPTRVIHDGKEKLIYFYWNQMEEHHLYVWTQIPMLEFDGEGSFGALITSSIEPIYPWNFFFQSVNETWFWENHVLKKDSNGNYLYLQRIL